MLIWRFSKYADLSGRGGLAASGRWHTRPKSIVYCADDAQTAYDEIVRQLPMVELLPTTYRLIEIDVPGTVRVARLDIDDLDPTWNERIVGWSVCQPIGDAWLRAGESAVLAVPSAARSGAYNYLINPAARTYDDIAITRVIESPFPADLIDTGTP